MDRKTILIDIIARFTEQGLKNAASGLDSFLKNLKNFNLGGGAGQADALGGSFQKLGEIVTGLAPQLGRLGPAAGKLGGALAGLSPQVALVVGALAALHSAGVPIVPAFESFKNTLDTIKAPIEIARNLIDKLKEGLAALARQAAAGLGKLLVGGLRAAGSAVNAVISPFRNFFDILVQGVRSRAVTQFFSSVAEALDFIRESAIGANIHLETTANTFRAFAKARGGAAGRDIGAEQLAIVRELAIQTGVSFDELVRASRRFPQVVGNNLELFTRLVRQTINLAFLDPDQGLKGAAFAISNATEGTARGFTSLRTRFEVNAAVINRALQNTSDPIKALEQVLSEIGVTESFVSDQANTFAVSLQQIQGVLTEIFRIGGIPIFEKMSEQIQVLRDRLFELRPQLFGIAQAIGEAIVEILERLGFFQSNFLETFDPIEAFRAGVEFVRRIVNGIFTGINQFLIPAIRALVGVINRALGRETVQVATEEDTKQQTNFAGALDKVKEKFREAAEARDRAIEQAKSAAEAARLQAEAERQAAREAAALAGLQERVAREGAKLSDLREAERNQKAVLKVFENTLRDAQRAVDRARDRLKLFDLQTADIPERFTRARRRQLELEILRAEQAARARKDAVELAREQLELTKEQLRSQEELYGRLKQLLDDLRKSQEEAVEEEGAGIDIGLAETTLEVGKLNEETQKFAEQAAEILRPLTEDFVNGIDAVKEGLAGINFGPIVDTIISGVSNAIQVFLTFITTVQSKWNEIVALFQDRSILGVAAQLGKDLGVHLIASMTRAISDWLRANPITGPISNWIASGFQAAFDLLKEGGGIGGIIEGLGIGGGNFGPNLGGGFSLANLPQFGLGNLAANLNLNLNADETRRIMEEGTYGTIIDLFGAGAP